MSNIIIALLIITVSCNINSVAQAQSSYQISGPMVDGGGVFNFEADRSISLDGEYIVYLADQDVDGVNELYSVSSMGGTPIKLNLPLVGGGRVASSYLISADSKYVVFDATTDNGNAIYSVPIAGGNPTVLSSVGAGRIITQDFSITSDGKRVIFMASPEGGDVNLYTVAINGGTIAQLDASLTNETDVTDFIISPDDQRVVFVGFTNINSRLVQLHSVSINGGTVTTLFTPNSSYGEFDQRYSITSDSRHVIFRYRESSIRTLYSISITGGIERQLSLDAPNQVADYRVSPNSDQVIFRSQNASSRMELYSVGLTNGAPIAIKPEFSIKFDASYFGYQITANGERVIYRADQITENKYELFSAPISGGAAIKLHEDFTADADVTSFQVSSDARLVVYSVFFGTTIGRILYKVEVSGANLTQISAKSTTDNRAPNRFKITNDSETVIYKAKEQADSVSHLYKMSINGGATRKLNAPLPIGSILWSYDPDPISEFVVYTTLDETTDQFTLFAASIKNELMCLPIKTKKGSIAVICL